MYYYKRRFFNARSKNISFRGTGTKYSMVRFFGRFIDRD
uniref:Photosystem I subunit IX n=3 Tax=Astereae TaxID=102809 RepID=A0A3G1I656_9ASTR|nr:photosystem I subunit IX [Aster altaicus]YP_010120111.1 photosystem I subunit IX [Erigeron multiradiatus]YP_010307486.1 photosystem I subunit IX [Heteropappus gouldii]QRI59446.1 photosystem I subunit IX [Erigeron breviscapus]ARR27853.1 photosystem I subunit IX [Aster altaicus]QRC36842.1 photosystem I subunit IX [Erigeron multiradiatus]ULU22630.1 photosystem I subunit IX [Heteropappus gouldii]